MNITVGEIIPIGGMIQTTTEPLCCLMINPCGYWKTLYLLVIVVEDCVDGI